MGDVHLEARLSTKALFQKIRLDGRIVYCPRCDKAVDKIEPLAQPVLRTGKRVITCDCGAAAIAVKPLTLWSCLVK
jgi:hypothetical protein